MRPEDIGWSEGALGGGAVRVRWLGTAGFAVEHDGHTLLLDPYVTRASLARCALSHLVPDEYAVRSHVPKADAIVVGHTHFDHVLDVPLIARLTGAKVFGSRSAAALCRAENVRDAQIDVVERAAPVERDVGPFRLRFLPSAHSRLAMGRVPFAGEIIDCDDVPLRMPRYKCGAVFGVEIKVGGRTIFHLGSAELVDASWGAANVDLLLLCVAGWTSSKDLPERVVRKLAPRAVLLSHWDNFFRPLEKPAIVLPAMQLPRLVDRLTRTAPDTRVGTVPILGAVTV